MQLASMRLMHLTGAVSAGASLPAWPSSIGPEIVASLYADDSDAMSLLQLSAERPARSQQHSRANIDVALSASRARGERAAWPDMDYWPASVELPNFDVTRPIKIVEWTDYIFLSETAVRNTPNCSFDMLYDYHMESNGGVIGDPDFDISDADVVIFHLARMVGKDSMRDWHYVLPRKKREGQLWFAMCGEPRVRPETGVDCRLANDPETMKLMDGYSDFSLKSDYPGIQDPVHEDVLRAPIPDFSTRKPAALATMAISDCAPGERKDWFKEVMAAFMARGVQLLSYGACIHNSEEPGKVPYDVDPTHHWINPEAARPFKIIGENVIEPWYVTEKIWDALAEGTIPVYWGPPEVKLWVPPGSFIYVQDFNSTDALVDRLVSFTEEDFAAAWAWKKQPTSEWGGWDKAWKLSHYTLLPRFCEAAARYLDRRDAAAVDSRSQSVA